MKRLFKYCRAPLVVQAHDAQTRARHGWASDADDGRNREKPTFRVINELADHDREGLLALSR
jgi:hypothetical protein